MTMWITELAVALALVLTSSAPTVDGTEVQRPPASVAVDLESWEAESFRIDLPESWEQQDLSNRTYLTSTPVDERAHFRQPSADGEGAEVLLRYTAEAALEPAPTASALKGILEEGRDAMAGLPPEDLQYFVEDKGHGCLDGFEVLRAPETMMMSGAPGVHYGYDYEYACFTNGGPVRGWAWVAYSPDGRKHHIFMTAYEEVWIRDHQILQAVAASVAVPQ